MSAADAAPRSGCPVLLRVFVQQGFHSRPTDYSGIDKVPKCPELQFSVWPDYTLREITTLIQAAHPPARGALGASAAAGDVAQLSAAVTHASRTTLIAAPRRSGAGAGAEAEGDKQQDASSTAAADGSVPAAAASSGTRFRGPVLKYALVYPDASGCYVMRDVGRIAGSGGSGAAAAAADDGSKTLVQCKFQTGDYLDVAVMPAR